MVGHDEDRSNSGTARSRITLHLAPLDVWLAQTAGQYYIPESFDREGFIHCTDGEARAIEVGNRYYTGDARQYCLLEIDRDRVTAPVVYEDDALVYPHVYGALNLDAIHDVRAVVRDETGRFVALGPSIRSAVS